MITVSLRFPSSGFSAFPLTSYPGFVFRLLAAGPPAAGLYAHYHLSEELGRGSFATVMKAMNRENGQWYAVKMIQASKLKAAAARRESRDNDGLRGDQQTLQGYEREINILEKLRHPNICQLREVFYEEHTISRVLPFPSYDRFETPALIHRDM